jgi:hypothetical protein
MNKENQKKKKIERVRKGEDTNTMKTGKKGSRTDCEE